MKVGFTTDGTKLEDQIDPRFGRAARFLIFDTETRTFEVLDNSKNLNLSQGAGIQSAQNLLGAGVKAVVSGHCGPKAFRVLAAGGAKVYLTETVTIAEALELFESDKLTLLESANVEGHWM